MADSIGFDLDGTLWDFAPRYADFFAEAVRGMEGVHQPTVPEVFAVTGLPAIAYVENLFPELKDADTSVKLSIFRRAERNGCDAILREGGILYDGLEEMLQKLSARYALFIASNCEPTYLNNFLTYYGFRHYFTDVICQDLTIGETTKGQNIRTVMRRNGFRHTVFVGDAQSDADAAAEAGVPFIWASYGYGSVPTAKYRIGKPLELVSLMETL